MGIINQIDKIKTHKIANLGKPLFGFFKSNPDLQKVFI
jgi:hypothetical protein